MNYSKDRSLKKVPKSEAEFDEQEISKDGKRKKKIRFKAFSRGLGIDMPLLFLTLIILSIGLVTLFSASYAKSYYDYGDSLQIILSQVRFAAIGLTVMLLLTFFDYHQYHHLAIIIYIISVILLLLVPIMSYEAFMDGEPVRWLTIFGIQFQPSEIAKFALILMFAHMISKRPTTMHTFRHGFLPFMIVFGLLAGLVIIEKHVSATAILSFIAILMMFIGGTRMRFFIPFIILVAVVLAFILLFSDRFGYALERIVAWLDPLNVQGGDTNTHQIKQSIYTLASGQLLGVGLGQSRQKYGWLPESQNDFIFAIFCEEMGFIGVIILIILFALLIWRGVYVAIHAKDKFGMMLGLGIIFQIGIQIILNLGVVTSTIPVTGISLPFFSSGGTSMTMLLAEMGILLQISRGSNINKA